MICQTLAEPPIKNGFWILTSIIFKGPQTEFDEILNSILIKKINYSPTFKVSNYYENYDDELFDFMKHFNHGKSVNSNCKAFRNIWWLWV